jgi:putative restriction endonuclease
MKAVLTSSPGTHYDDLPEQRYHFPRTYLKQVEAAIGDWIIYYEPRRDEGLSSSGGRQAYFAVALVTAVREDPAKRDHFYAEISHYLEFDQPVPFREADHYYESLLRKPDGSTSKGAFGRAVRNVPDEEFRLILQAGFATMVEPWEKADAIMAEEHPLIEQLVRRRFRDRAFQRRIRVAYNNTCAITGLCLINGGGRPEVEAAHIRPVEADGPDSVRNGLALTGTVHWLFDRGLITLDDDYRLVVAEREIPSEMMRLLSPGQPVRVPGSREQQPHPGFIHWHRKNRFGQ